MSCLRGLTKMMSNALNGFVADVERRANSATKDAPETEAHDPVGGLAWIRQTTEEVEQQADPSSDMATTTRPVTAPPRKAIRKALLMLVRAALAVRILARMETYIPVRLAKPE